MHNIEHRTCPLKCDRKKVEAEINKYVSQKTWEEGGGGLVNPIRWLDMAPYASYEEAEAAIRRLDSGWYDSLAVRYEMHHQPGDSAKFTELRNKLNEAYKEYERRDRILYAETVTSNLITCRVCGSKLARTYLKTNMCPVCRSEIRPDHMLKSVSVAEERWHRAQKAVEDYEKKHGKKEICWLIKFEYHT